MQKYTIPGDNELTYDVPSIPIITDNSNISRHEFHEDFVFGVGTSAYQHEGSAAKGGRGQSIWDEFTLRTPRRIADGSNGNVAVDMYSKYKDDIMAMKRMGFGAYRFSISWSRILPGGRPCMGVNQEGIDYYNDVINTVLDNGMQPYVTLFHWDLPQCLELEYGGFLCKDFELGVFISKYIELGKNRIVNDFREYAELCFWEFGDRVKYWTTLNEPSTYSVQGYVLRTFPPSKSAPINTFPFPHSHRSVPELVEARRTEDLNLSDKEHYEPKANLAKDVYDVARNLLLAHATAVQSYRTKFQGQQNGQIGISLVCDWFEPLDCKNDDDIDASKRALDFMLGWFLQPVLTGKYPKSMRRNVPRENLKRFTKEERELLQGSIDFLGLNYYTGKYAANVTDPQGEGYFEDQKVEFSTDRNGVPIGREAGSWWLHIVPWGIYSLLEHINNTYKEDIPPIYITENGVDEKSDFKLTAYEACVDTVRIQYHQDHLANLRDAINKFEDLEVKGYFAWSWCDNFEWNAGYSVRFGLIYVDFMNHLKRYPKKSAIWFAKFLTNDNLLGDKPIVKIKKLPIGKPKKLLFDV